MLNSCSVNLGRGEHIHIQSDQNQAKGGSVLPTCPRKDLFVLWRGVGNIRRAKGRGEGSREEGSSRQAMRRMKDSVQRHAKMLQAEYGFKRINSQSWFIHLKWTYPLSILAGSSGASCLVNHGFYNLLRWLRSEEEDALSPSIEEAGKLVPQRQCQISSPCRLGGRTPRGLEFSPSWKPFQSQQSRALSHTQGSPQSFLSTLGFHDRSGQSRLIIDAFAILEVYLVSITFGNRKHLVEHLHSILKKYTFILSTSLHFC